MVDQGRVPELERVESKSAIENPGAGQGYNRSNLVGDDSDYLLNQRQ